jgi:hypothetical protein
VAQLFIRLIRSCLIEKCFHLRREVIKNLAVARTASSPKTQGACGNCVPDDARPFANPLKQRLEPLLISVCAQRSAVNQASGLGHIILNDNSS